MRLYTPSPYEGEGWVRFNKIFDFWLFIRFIASRSILLFYTSAIEIIFMRDEFNGAPFV